MTLRRLIDALLHIHDTPARTAAAFALGVFFSFSPFLGFQVAGSFALAFLLRLNRVAVFAGLNANLPWFLVPWYVLTTTVAAAAMGTRLPDDFAGIPAVALLGELRLRRILAPRLEPAGAAGLAVRARIDARRGDRRPGRLLRGTGLPAPPRFARSAGRDRIEPAWSSC